ncbi:phage tail protein, partial [Klebsiella pneumoniae]|nr:phage tail protein [Klebsiella pneumoniae]
TEFRDKLFLFAVDVLSNYICDICLIQQLNARVIVSADGDVSSVEAVPEPDEPDEMWAVSRG